MMMIDFLQFSVILIFQAEFQIIFILYTNAGNKIIHK